MHDPDVLARFETPGPEFGPTPLWWWSGAPVTREGIRWQLERFAEGRINNLVVMNLAPKGPTYGAKPDEPVWFSEDWWSLFEYACEVAAEVGVKLWFYDQIGFSGANLQGQITASHPEAAGRGLHSRVAVVGDGGVLPLLGRENLIGVYGDRGTDGGWTTIKWHAGVATALAGTDVRIVTWEEKAFDYLDPIACGLLMDFVHGEFERRLPQFLGSVIVGSFQDELPGMPTWSAGFLDRFEEITGYDLVPHLPSLWESSADDDARVRYDYHRVRTQLAEDALFGPLGDWHTKRGMLIGADQFNPARAGWPTQGVQLYADYFATHRHYNAVGSDHEGDSRIHSSMADLYDHPRVWIESFHSSGWGGTLEDTWDWLLPFFRSGATLYNPHASFYNTHAGWFEWAPPSTDFRQPYYALYPQFSTAVARVSSLLTWGKHVVEVGVLYPSSTMQSMLPPDLPVDHFGAGVVGSPYDDLDKTQATYLELAGTNNWFRSAPGLLDGLGIDFDIIDEDSIRRSRVAAGSLTVNDLSFTTIILPSVDYLDADTAKRLTEFLDAGGRVVVIGRPPRWSTGRFGDDVPVAALAAHPSVVCLESADELQRALAGSQPHVIAGEPVRARRSGDSVVAFVAAAFPNASAYPLRRPGDLRFRWDDYDFDSARYAPATELRVSAQVSDLEVWNPATGERWPVAVQYEDGFSTGTIDFHGAPAVFVAWREGQPGPGDVETIPETSGIKEPLDSGWTGELVPTLDNTWGDFALPASPDGIPLELWKADWADGEAEPSETKATFGQRVLIGGPFPHGAVAPLTPEETAGILDGGELGGPEWTVHEYSLSRGVDQDPTTPLGPKGFVPDPFVRHGAAAEHEEIVVRTILRVDEPGTFDLTVFGSAAKGIWFDGVLASDESDGYYLTVPVTFYERTAVLEYRLGTDETTGMFASLSSGSESGFTLDRPGRRAPFPEFVGPTSTDASSESTIYRRRFTLIADATSASVVTGSASALALAIDGTVLARQEKVEYYESDWGGNPMYFTHELGAITAGEHDLSVEVFSTDPRGALYVDLVLEFSDGSRQVLVSDGLWTTDSTGTPVVPRRGLSGQLTHARAALRAHPLAAAHWLVGDPDVGETSVSFESSISAVERRQRYVVTVPSGSTAFDLPTDVESATLGNVIVGVEHRRIVLEAPLQKPTLLELVTAPRAFSTGGAAWDGPILVTTASAPTALGDWRDIGLGAWSGGIRYTRRFSVDEGESVRLDLGRVKGAVEVSVDDEAAGSAFCVPYSFVLGTLSRGEHQLSVTVYSTLAQRFDSASPTTWIFPSQLEAGILGPVAMERTRT